jgi:hypothetical protein
MSRNDQNRVITCDRADHLRKFCSIDSHRQRLRLTWIRTQNKQLLNLVKPAQILGNGATNFFLSASVSTRWHSRFLIGSVSCPFHKSQFLNISGNCGLRGVETAFPQPLPQFVLARQGFLCNEVENGRLPVSLHWILYSVL